MTFCDFLLQIFSILCVLFTKFIPFWEFCNKFMPLCVFYILNLCHSVSLIYQSDIILFTFQLLLVSGSKDPQRWVVPGGGIEPTEDAGVAAVREVWEEAGVKGTLGRCLGVFEVRSKVVINRSRQRLCINTNTLV